MWKIRYNHVENKPLIVDILFTVDTFAVDEFGVDTLAGDTVAVDM